MQRRQKEKVCLCTKQADLHTTGHSAYDIEWLMKPGETNDHSKVCKERRADCTADRFNCLLLRGWIKMKIVFALKLNSELTQLAWNLRS